MKEPVACELLSWSQVERLSDRLVAKIVETGFRPDIVIAIARGGYVPARLVCDQMDIFNLTSIRIVHYQAGAEMLANARLSMPLSTDIRGLKVLVVDDVSDTGDTLQLALEHVRSFEPADVKLAVLQHKIVSTVMPDFYGQKVVKWRWIIYPWAIHEDIGQFLDGMQPLPRSAGEALARFRDDYGIRVPTRVLEKILAERCRS